MKYMIWFHVFEESLTSYFKNHLKLVHILLLAEFSNMLNCFQTLIFENPYLLRAVGWATMPCMLKMKNLFNMCMNRVVVMSYIHVLHGILYLYAHICLLYMYASKSLIISILIGIFLFIHVCVCVCVRVF